MSPRGAGGLAPRLPRPAAMLLCALAVLIAALTLPGSVNVWSLNSVLGLELRVPMAGAVSMLLTATGLLLLLFRRRAAGLLFGLAGAVAALVCGWEAAAQPGLTVIDASVASSGRTIAVSLFIAAIATALVAWPEPGAARWAGVELTTGFLIAAGAVGLVSGYDGADSSLSIAAGLPAPVAIGLVLLGLALQGLIFDPVGQRGRRLRPVMFATLTIAMGVWLAIALAYARPDSELHTLVLAAVLVAGPMGAWLIARGLARPPASRNYSQDDADEEFWVPPRAVLSSDSAPGAVDAVAQMTVAGVAMVNTEGRLTVFNEALARMYGFDEAPYMGHASADALRLYDADQRVIAWPQSPLGRAMEGEDSTDVDLTFRPVGKPKVEALISARAFNDAEGRFAGAVMLVRDVTAQRERERAFDDQVQLLEQSSAELKRITDVSAHHLQEPVRGITSYAQLLQRKLADDEDTNEYLGYLMQESQRIKSLVTDLLRYLELEADKVHPEMLDLAATLEGVRSDVAARHPQVELALLHGALPHVYADPEMLNSLLDAVVDNTAQFGAKGMPAVTVSAQRNDAAHAIEVLFEDNGPGIANEHLERAFELFSQLQNIGDTQGNGVGLAMVRKIARVHGGDAVLEPDAMGGIRLLVTLPLPNPDSN